MLASWDAALGAKGGQGVASATASAASSSLPTEALAASLALLCVWRVRVACTCGLGFLHCCAPLQRPAFGIYAVPLPYDAIVRGVCVGVWP